MHANRTRIYEIPLHTAESRERTMGNPVVTVRSDRTVSGRPLSWKIESRDEAANTLWLARRMGYAIIRRYPVS